jgi:hypothetical protein
MPFLQHKWRVRPTPQRISAECDGIEFYCQNCGNLKRIAIASKLVGGGEREKEERNPAQDD